jgi:hypothetical protein
MMPSAAQPLAEALHDWRSARTAVRSTTSGSPEWEEATIVADNAAWRYHDLLSGRKDRLAAASQGVLGALEEIRDLRDREVKAEEGSPVHQTVAAQLREAAQRLLAYADEEQRQGLAMAPTDETILSIEKEPAPSTP